MIFIAKKNKSWAELNEGDIDFYRIRGDAVWQWMSAMKADWLLTAKSHSQNTWFPMRGKGAWDSWDAISPRFQSENDNKQGNEWRQWFSLLVLWWFCSQCFIILESLKVGSVTFINNGSDGNICGASCFRDLRKRWCFCKYTVVPTTRNCSRKWLLLVVVVVVRTKKVCTYDVQMGAFMVFRVT